jgi:dihydrolipoamide dehydrogenase
MEAMMEMIKTDLLIIGAGPGGYVAAIYAKKQGLDVILVDKEWVGGTCLNIGCIPTKALVHSAENYNHLLNDTYGVHVKDATINLEEVINHKNDIKDQLVSGIAFLLKKHGVEYIQGEASFVDQTKVQVNDHLIEAKDIIIATGSKPKHLPIPGQEYAVSSRALLDLKKMPQSICVIGGGVIGMEFAFIYAHMGVKVTVIEFMPRILPGIDKELSMRLMPFAKKAGIDILTQSKVLRIEKDGDQRKVFYERKDKEASVISDVVLEAVGRGPVVDGLNLEKTNVHFDEKNGVPVNSYMQTNVEHIYAIGDVNNIMQLAHVASHQAMIAVDFILGRKKPFDQTKVPAIIFTSPQIATVGITEEMAKEEGIEIDVIKTPYSANGKAMILDGKRGYLKLIREQSSQKLIGAMILGKDAEHLIASLTLAIQQGLKAEDVYHTIFAHPTTEELVHEAALGLDQLAIHYME